MPVRLDATPLLHAMLSLTRVSTFAFPLVLLVLLAIFASGVTLDHRAERRRRGDGA